MKVLINKQGKVMYACGHKSWKHWKYSSTTEIEETSRKLCIRCKRKEELAILNLIQEVDEYADSLEVI